MFQPDVIVVGGGLIGLSCATSISRRGPHVLVITTYESGSASSASAGILAPSVGSPPGLARTLGLKARDMYPDYVAELASRTGFQVALDRSGVLAVARDDAEANALRSAADENAQWIEGDTLHEIEPALAPLAGALLHSQDGAVDSVALLEAVTADAVQNDRVTIREGRVIELETDRTPIRVTLADGERLEAATTVIAAGAWVSLLRGLPRRLPVVPVRGQIVAFAGIHVRHVIMGPPGYVLTRGNRTLVGSTMEHVGFDAGTTKAGAELLHAMAQALVPRCAEKPVVDQWAGLRPITPDSLPLVGPEPECEGLFYACGHSRNGVLLAPLTATLIADWITMGAPRADATVYDPARFAG